MTTDVKAPSSADITRYLSRIDTLTILIDTNPQHPHCDAWKRDRDYYTRLYRWANDNQQMITKALQSHKPKSLWQRLFTR